MENLIGADNVSNDFYKVSEYCLNHVAKNIFGINRHESYLVARPRSVKQVAELVRYAHSNGIPVFIRGGGSGYAGGDVASESGIVLEMTGLNRVLEVDRDGGYVKCEAGISVKELNNYLEKFALWWPHDPGSREWATVGGSISTLGVGAFSTKYGYASDSVTGMTIVTADGDTVKVGSKVKHHDSSYNLTDTITSGEGTLCIVVEATLKVFKKPQERAVGIGIFEKFEDAVKFCYDLFDSGWYPESLMLEDSLRFTLEGLAPFIDIQSPSVEELKLGPQKTVAIFSYAGTYEAVQTSTAHTKSLIVSNGGTVVGDEGIIKAYWKSKTELPSWSKEVGNLKVHSFVPSVPLNKAPEFSRKYAEIAGTLKLAPIGARYYVTLPTFECTISPTVMFDDDNESATHAYEEFTRIFSREVIRMEGSPASTTGVGMKLVEIIEKLEDTQQLKLARQIKAAFDPSKLLNPGKKLSKWL